MIKTLIVTAAFFLVGVSPTLAESDRVCRFTLTDAFARKSIAPTLKALTGNAYSRFDPNKPARQFIFEDHLDRVILEFDAASGLGSIQPAYLEIDSCGMKVVQSYRALPYAPAKPKSKVCAFVLTDRFADTEIAPRFRIMVGKTFETYDVHHPDSTSRASNNLNVITLQYVSRAKYPVPGQRYSDYFVRIDACTKRVLSVDPPPLVIE
jgi:hypothetical protein